MPFRVRKWSGGRAVLYSLGIDPQLHGAVDKICRRMAGAATGTLQDLAGVSNSMLGSLTDEKLSLKTDFDVKLSFQQNSIFVSTACVLQAALISLLLKRTTQKFPFLQLKICLESYFLGVLTEKCIFLQQRKPKNNSNFFLLSTCILFYNTKSTFICFSRYV